LGRNRGRKRAKVGGGEGGRGRACARERACARKRARKRWEGREARGVMRGGGRGWGLMSDVSFEHIRIHMCVYARTPCPHTVPADECARGEAHCALQCALQCVMQYVAVWCCSVVLQCVAVCCSVDTLSPYRQRRAHSRRSTVFAVVLVALCAAMCITVSCSLSQCVAVCYHSALQSVTVYCSVWHCPAVCCSVLQCEHLLPTREPATRALAKMAIFVYTPRWHHRAR